MLTVDKVEIGRKQIAGRFHLASDFFFSRSMAEQARNEAMGMKV